MNKNIKVSVIIPVYGVEKYIERCVRSLMEQTLEEIEFIFVDDCTKDSSIAVLENVLKDYPSRQEQVKILHHAVNKGLPEARRTGLAAAGGLYAAHCDSDDWVDRDMYRKMYEKACATDADIVICDYFVAKGDNLNPRRTFIENLSKSDIYRKYYSQELPWNLWTKLIRRNLYDNPEILPPVDTQGEDMCLYLQLLYFTDSITYVPESLYYYRFNTDTAIHSPSPDTVLKRLEQATRNLDLLRKFFSTHNRYSESTDDFTYIKLSLRELLFPIIGERRYHDLWKSTFPELNRKVLTDRYITLKHKIKFYLVYFRILTPKI